MTAEEHDARLDVSDNGQGIAAEFLPQIFDMFGQGTASIVRGTKGLGIGLAMVQQIVELHGGRVQAFSKGSGQGSRFTFWLPLDSRQTEREGIVPLKETVPLAGVRILLVDDNEDVVETFTQLLEFSGGIVLGTTSAHEALQLLKSDVFDLLISDIGMPEMDGLRFISAVREIKNRDELPAIAVTGLGRPADIEKALAAGFNTHVNKPVELNEIERVACRLLK